MDYYKAIVADHKANHINSYIVWQFKIYYLGVAFPGGFNFGMVDTERC